LYACKEDHWRCELPCLHVLLQTVTESTRKVLSGQYRFAGISIYCHVGRLGSGDDSEPVGGSALRCVLIGCLRPPDARAPVAPIPLPILHNLRKMNSIVKALGNRHFYLRSTVYVGHLNDQSSHVLPRLPRCRLEVSRLRHVAAIQPLPLGELTSPVTSDILTSRDSSPLT
jgi:hypothetical protein